MRCFSVIFHLWLICVTTSVLAAEPQQLTRDGQRKLAVRFSANGESLIYAAYSSPTRVTLTRLTLESEKTEPIYPGGTAHQFDPDFSADGRYHVYCRSMGSPQIALVIKDTQQESEAVFKPEGARSTARGPRIIPGGDRVVFTLSAPGGQQIASVDMRGQDLRKLTESTGINCWPAVSPDGKQIAFCSSRSGNLELFIMSADGGDPRQLTETPQREMRPAWSPDGRRIAFVSLRDGNHEIYIADADGQNVVRLTDHPDLDDWPAWSPDGNRVVTISQRRGRFDLFLWDAP